jgi:hypothetical protein
MIHDKNLKQQIDAFTSELHTMANTRRFAEERINLILHSFSAKQRVRHEIYLKIYYHGV